MKPKNKENSTPQENRRNLSKEKRIETLRKKTRKVIKRLSEHLTYVWTFCLYHTGKKQLINNINIMCGWKPILIFSNGNKKMRFSAYDVIISEQREKFSHIWQQNKEAIKPLIEIFTKPGELIVDPFCGSGSFGIAAKEFGRRFIGAEIQ